MIPTTINPCYFLMWRWTWIRTSALLSAFFNKPSKKVADFTGQRPWPLEWRDLAWAVRPTPPQNRRKGMACLWARTSSRYRLAFTSVRPLIACAVSLVFWKATPILRELKNSPRKFRNPMSLIERWNDSESNRMLATKIHKTLMQRKAAYLEMNTKVRTSGLTGCKTRNKRDVRTVQSFRSSLLSKVLPYMDSLSLT